MGPGGGGGGLPWRCQSIHMVVVGLNLAHMKLHITRGHVQIIPKQVTDFGAGISENTLVASDRRRDLQGLDMATSRLARNCF